MKIVALSDFDPIGSGYQGIATHLCQGLVERGHEVKAVGLHYAGQEHRFGFSLIPTPNPEMALHSIVGLKQLWDFDVLLVLLDIPLQRFILDQLQQFRSAFKYVGVMPVESDPLCMSWAMTLLQMDRALIISEFGTAEAQKANVYNARYLPVGLDQEAWIPATPEEKTQWRRGILNVTDPETFVVLTVAENQERKNLWAAVEAFRQFARMVPNSRYVLVTRENSPVGWSLRDLFYELGVQDKCIIIEKGMSVEDLRKIYGSADCFLLTSKAEGLGMPILEAMAMGIPCVGTKCTGIQELLDNGRGLLVPPEYSVRDPFGNGWRYWIDPYSAAMELKFLAVYKGYPDLEQAKQFVSQRTWAKAVQVLQDTLQELA